MVNENARDHALYLLGVFTLLLAVLSLILILGIRAESKHLEREFILRLNYLTQSRNETVN